MVAVFGHRGARGLLPENTLEGFSFARTLGVTGVEFDVGMTADAVPVVHHDSYLNPNIARTPEGEYVKAATLRLRELTYRQLSTYDVGRLRDGSDEAARFPTQRPQDDAKIPTLDEVLTTCTPLDLLVEIKTFPDRPEDTASPRLLVQAVIQRLAAHHLLEQAVLYAFDWRVLDEAAIREPRLQRGCLTEAATVQNASLWFGRADLAGFKPEQPGAVPRLVAKTGAKVWAPDYKTLNQYEVDLAHELGLAVIPWTVNKPDDILAMLTLGVDGMISDWPDRVLETLRQRNLHPMSPGFVASHSVSYR